MQKPRNKQYRAEEQAFIWARFRQPGENRLTENQKQDLAQEILELNSWNDVPKNDQLAIYRSHIKAHATYPKPQHPGNCNYCGDDHVTHIATDNEEEDYQSSGIPLCASCANAYVNGWYNAIDFTASNPKISPSIYTVTL